MATSQEIIKAMGSALHQRHLKARGYKKSGNTWVRLDEWPRVIHIQCSRWNTSSAAQFTLNFGLFIRSLHDAWEGSPVKGGLKEYNCTARARIGELLPEGKDTWWKVSPGMSAEELADDVFQHIEQTGIPWFERLSSYSAVAAEFENDCLFFQAAIAYHFGGDSEAAATAIAMALARSAPNFHSELIRLASKHGIRIGDPPDPEKVAETWYLKRK